MPRTRLATLLAALLLARPTLVLAQRDAVVREVQAADRALNDALAGGDTAEIGRFYAADYVHVDASGQRQSRSERLAVIGAGARRFQPIPPADSATFQVLGDVVVETARIQAQGASGAHSWATRVWTRRDGRWQLVLAQTTRIAER